MVNVKIKVEANVKVNAEVRVKILWFASCSYDYAKVKFTVKITVYFT